MILPWDFCHRPDILPLWQEWLVAPLEKENETFDMIFLLYREEKKKKENHD